MNKYVYKIGSGIAAFSLLALSAAPGALANTFVKVSGNGAFSDNNVRVNNNNSTRVNQANFSDINNRVATFQNTGGNDASFNTGGNTSIRTGDASSNVRISNEAGANFASIGNCGNCN